MNLSSFKAWASDTGVRAVKTFAQSLAALIAGSINVDGGSGILPSSVTLGDDLKLAGLAAGAALLHNLNGLRVGNFSVATTDNSVTVTEADQVQAADANAKPNSGSVSGTFTLPPVSSAAASEAAADLPDDSDGAPTS